MNCRTRRLLTISLLTIVVFGSSVYAKEWRGITPLQSSRADVDRLLGAPTQSDKSSYYYDLPTEIAVITFQLNTCEDIGGKFGFGWNVSVGKVTTIGVIPKTRITKEAAGVTADFKIEDKNAGFVYYESKVEGLLVETLKGSVTNIVYHPTSKDESLKCSMVERCCWDVFPKLDEYARLSKNDELVRLVFFIDNLKENLSRGVMVIKGRDAAERRNNIVKATALKNYVCRLDKFSPHRILVVDGGHYQIPATELHMYPIAGEISWIYLFPEKDPNPKPKPAQRRK